MGSRRLAVLLLAAAASSVLVPWRVLGVALFFRRLRTVNPLYFDGPAALAEILIALEQDGYTA